MPNFTLNDVLDSDVRLLMRLLNDKQGNSKDKPKKTVDFTKMSVDDVKKMR